MLSFFCIVTVNKKPQDTMTVEATGKMTVEATGEATHHHTQCSRFNTNVEATLAVPWRQSSGVDRSKCPNGTTSTAACTHAQPWMPPPWFVDAEEIATKYMAEIIKCHPR